ncbi:Uncharacterised protein [Mycobacteroides abscessus subsp. abscessus]|nr:Uncharacterised protein [Mycobacteroides abscessus subsp. abscessus]
MTREASLSISAALGVARPPLSAMRPAARNTNKARAWLGGSLGIAICPPRGMSASVLCFWEYKPSGTIYVAPTGASVALSATLYSPRKRRC